MDQETARSTGAQARAGHLLSAIEHFARRVAPITRDGTVVIGAKEQMLAPDNIARAYAADASNLAQVLMVTSGRCATRRMSS